MWYLNLRLLLCVNCFVFKEIISIFVAMAKTVKSKKKVRRGVPKQEKRMPRPYKATTSFNKKEYEMLMSYIDKHGIGNRARFIREIVLLHLWKKAGEQSPRLFDDNFAL